MPLFTMTADEAGKALDLLEAGAQAGEPRALVLLMAANCVLRDRNRSYGEPEDNFSDIAECYYGMSGEPTDPWDVATFSMAIKEGRLRNDQWSADGHVDLIGYAACRARIAALEVAEEEEANSRVHFPIPTFDPEWAADWDEEETFVPAGYRDPAPFPEYEEYAEADFDEGAADWGEYHDDEECVCPACVSEQEDDTPDVPPEGIRSYVEGHDFSSDVERREGLAAGTWGHQGVGEKKCTWPKQCEHFGCQGDCKRRNG